MGQKGQWQEKAYKVQVKYGKEDLQSFLQHLQTTHALKSQLAVIREKWKKQKDRLADHVGNLNCEADTLFCSNTQDIYSQLLCDIPNLCTHVNRDMIMLTRSVLEKVLDICGEPKCGYCLVALGSLARGEMTPYSDLEFLFLIELKSDEVLQYFERAAVTMYFLIGNLG